MEFQSLINIDFAFNKPILIVFNKTDSVCGFDEAMIEYAFDFESLSEQCSLLKTVFVSALTGENIEQVKKWVQGDIKQGDPVEDLVEVKKSKSCCKFN
jgi:predicted GTPase